MHNKRIVHHDVKPANIMASLNFNKMINQELLDGCTYKLIDFGFCRTYDKDTNSAEECDRSIGTKNYFSPEKNDLFSFAPYNPYLADSYALGLSLCNSLVGNEALRQIKNESEFATMSQVFDIFVKKNVSNFEVIYSVIKRLLNSEKDRNQIDKILNLLN